MTAMARIIGIDLGTTNSLVAYMKDGKPCVIPGRAGRAMVPSVVAMTDNGLIVGDSAKEHLTRSPERTVYSVKRFMGKSLADVQNELAYFPYALTEQGGVIRIKLGEKTYSPPQISAMILKELKQRAEAHLGESITKAVITVPAYFNDSQRQATKDAGLIAGLEVLRIINEPTAASLAYGLQDKTQGTIAVYDFGGGTFDISILKLKNGIFEVLATNGDTHLGGDDLDRRIADLFLSEIQTGHHIDLTAYPDHMQAVRLEAERAKIRLSDELKTQIVVELPDGKGRYSRELTRDQLESMVMEIIERTLAPCRLALKDAELTTAQIDEIVFFDALPVSDDPNVGFVGDVHAPWGQTPPNPYGVYALPVADLLRFYGLNAQARQAMTFDELRAEISADRPVIVWVVGRVGQGTPIAYTSSEGVMTTVARFEHTVIVIGYDQQNVTVLDGYWVYTRSIQDFLNSWSVLGNMAVIWGSEDQL